MAGSNQVPAPGSCRHTLPQTIAEDGTIRPERVGNHQFAGMELDVHADTKRREEIS